MTWNANLRWNFAIKKTAKAIDPQRQISANRLPIALTMGEPGGISSEITVKAWQAIHKEKKDSAVFFLIDRPERYQDFAIPVIKIESPAEAKAAFPHGLPILSIAEKVHSDYGVANKDTAKAVIASIESAVAYCLSGQACAIVTNPIQKKVLADIGFSYPGHTEFLEHLTKTVQFHPTAQRTHRGAVMMLAAPNLRTVPVTVHTSLKNAITTLTQENIIRTCHIVNETLRDDFGIHNPRLSIAGLNPHAGEGGLFGKEDQEIIASAVTTLKNSGINVAGPLSADTLFHEEARATYEVAICMYHDQALIPVKTIDFHNTVNVTLGLPIIRTSPDHGCALDIAGKNMADPRSLIAAIKLAKDMAEHRLKVS